MQEKEFIIVDVETTGFRPNDGHSIIEIAAERMLNEKIIDEFHSLVLPEQFPLDKEAQAIHGISDELLQKEGRPNHIVIPEFVKFAQGLPLIGHNIGFDVSFINSHLVRLNQPTLSNKTIDTLQLARKYLIIPSYSLEKVSAYLKVPQPSAHRAKVDVEVTRQVFLKLNERAQLRSK
ncbi:3'-5' exonuclease [Patescibacteria group bacterium]|nr:3'-5' exonuclease [Patescibacteria group bacterium]MBU1890360.1 3'-5' exonuclease [Patescibacteria group bacterium]